jgi:hypothetical protein
MKLCEYLNAVLSKDHCIKPPFSYGMKNNKYSFWFRVINAVLLLGISKDSTIIHIFYLFKKLCYQVVSGIRKSDELLVLRLGLLVHQSGAFNIA